MSDAVPDPVVTKRLTDWSGCAGCAGKIPLGTLAGVVAGLPAVRGADVLVGPEGFSDAGVIRVAPGLALVQTIDFFGPLIDDPRAYGRIAAANALSDVYAMGGRPLSALNVVCFPDKDLSVGVLAEILAGGAEACAEAGVAVLGGHSIRDPEIKFGLSVTGVVDPDRVVTNREARAGDLLVLTKPLGGGTIVTAAKRGVIPSEGAGADVLGHAVAVMSRLNREASEAMVAAGVRAATDVTGFGLLGHAGNLAAGSGMSLRIRAGAVPLMPGARDLAAAGVKTRAVAGNEAGLAGRVRFDEGVPAELRTMLFEAQTSGGLLMAVPAGRLEELLRHLALRGVDGDPGGTACAAVVGEVLPRGDVELVVTA